MACFLSYLPHVSSDSQTKSNGGEREVKIGVEGASQSPHSLLYAMLRTIWYSPRLGSRVGRNPQTKRRDAREVVLIVLLLVPRVFVASQPELTNLSPCILDVHRPHSIRASMGMKVGQYTNRPPSANVDHLHYPLLCIYNRQHHNLLSRFRLRSNAHRLRRSPVRIVIARSALETEPLPWRTPSVRLQAISDTWEKVHQLGQRFW